MVQNENVLNKVLHSPNHSTTERRWKASVASTAWHEWDGECVVYVEEAATTHLLDAAAGVVLQTLLNSMAPLSIDELAKAAFNLSAETELSRSDAPLPENRRVPDKEAPPTLQAEERAALQAIMIDLERIGAARPHLP